MKSLIKFSLLFLFASVVNTACMKEETDTPESFDTAIDNREASTWICHKPEGNNPHAIWVDEHALEAHLAHGDELLDADGDGFTAINNCGMGSMDDCDDNNAAINPDAVEIPYDGIDNDCNESTPDDDLDQDGFLLAEDCDDSDASIFPGAEELCEDGIDNDCDGYTDCDDPDCTAVCSSECDAENIIFCDYLHYFDFDEPCPNDEVGQYGNGDALCIAEIYYGFFDPLGWDVKIWDNDFVLNNYCNGSDPDNDIGVLQVIYGRFNQVWEYRVAGQLSLYDENDNYAGEAFAPFNMVVDEPTAIAHAQFLSQLAAENGLTDICLGGPEF